MAERVVRDFSDIMKLCSVLSRRSIVLSLRKKELPALLGTCMEAALSRIRLVKLARLHKVTWAKSNHHDNKCPSTVILLSWPSSAEPSYTPATSFPALFQNCCFIPSLFLNCWLIPNLFPDDYFIPSLFAND